jgi:type VI secretion system protein ImpM
LSRPTLTPFPTRPGLYGKLHSHGDFVVRRLPREFVSGWDAWLQQGIVECKLAIGPAWEEKYRDAPVWRFVTAPGICGESAWTGIIQPSMDRVGRYFPLTIAVALPDETDVLYTLFAAASWYGTIEREAAAAFDSDVQLDELDRRIEQIAFPIGRIAHVDTTEDTLPIAQRVFPAIKLSLGQQSSYASVLDALSREQFTAALSRCAWLTTGTPSIEPALLMTKTLPGARHFCALFDGLWDTHGWESGTQVVNSSG